MLDLLALIEHPDALPADVALRLGREIMVLIEAEPPSPHCCAVTEPDGGVPRPR